MGFGKLMELLFKKENRALQRWLGAFLLALPVLFVFGGGFGREVDGHGRIFSGGWFREVFVLALCFAGILGLLLLVASFWERDADSE